MQATNTLISRIFTNPSCDHAQQSFVMSCWRSTRRTVNRNKAVTQLAFKKTDEGRSCLAETSLQVLLTLFLTLTRVSTKHNKFSIDHNT